MKMFRTALAAALVVPAFAGVAAAQTATQQVSYSVAAINQLSVSADPGALGITTAVAGSAPTSVSNSSTSYAITTNETGQKVTAQLDSPMQSGLTLKVQLAAPTGGTSAGPVALTSSAADVVTGISTLNESGRTITYTLEATALAGVVAASIRTVTFTIAAGV